MMLSLRSQLFQQFKTFKAFNVPVSVLNGLDDVHRLIEVST